VKRRPDARLTRLDAASDGLLRRMAKGENALLWIRARWDRIVGEPREKVEPVELLGRRLTLQLLDPAWRKPVQATLPSWKESSPRSPGNPAEGDAR
jgi:hypothetical protein